MVYFEPLDEPEWRRAHGVTCDNEAVGRLAFEELSSTHPPAYAVVSCGFRTPTHAMALFKERFGCSMREWRKARR